MKIRDKVCLSMGIVGFALVCLSMPLMVDSRAGDFVMLAGMVVLIGAPLLGIWWPARQAKGE